MEETISEILDTAEKFSAISRKNTVLSFNNYSEIPSLRVEVMDSSFMEHWAVMESNISRSFGKMFAYNGIPGDVYITYERTVTENLFRIVAYWATTQKSRRALEQKRRNIAEYGRRMEMEKSAPFVDRELDKEMECLEDGRENQTGL